jgi:hypothetical protein
MAWAEVSFDTSPDHESLIDALYNLFHGRTGRGTDSSLVSVDKKKEEHPPRTNPWVPHLSLCYDNPEGLGTSFSRSSIEDFMSTKCPTLEKAIDTNSDARVKFSRAVSGISLWNTAGTMSDWKCLDRIEF